MTASTSMDEETLAVSENSEPLEKSKHTQEIQPIETISLSLKRASDTPSSTISRLKIEHGKRRGFSKGILADFAKSTTIHGIPYICDVHRPWYERLLWFVFTSISFYFAFTMAWKTYAKWEDTPVILGFDETLLPIHKIPFPTVTICPEIKVDPYWFNFTEASEKFWHYIENLNSTVLIDKIEAKIKLKKFAALLHICEDDIVHRFQKSLPDSIQPSIVSDMMLLAFSVYDACTACMWNRYLHDCSDIINMVVTDDGVCYQFNGLEKKHLYRNASEIAVYGEAEITMSDIYAGNWSLEGGYPTNDFDTYPFRTAHVAANSGLQLGLEGNKRDFDYGCRSLGQGYKVFLHSPESVPGNHILISHNHEAIIKILPEYTIADENLRDFPPEKRKCFFNDERYLRYFRYYSQANCQAECLTNYTIQTCGCAKFWMPKPAHIPVCGVKDIDCYRNAQAKLNRVLQNETIQKMADPDFEIMCNCVPSCTSLEYNVEVSTAYFNMEDGILAATRESLGDSEETVRTILRILFKEPHFSAMKRSVLFNITTATKLLLIANCGGVLGLFMGLSVISVIELIGFFTLRLIRSVCMRFRSRNE